MTLDLNSLADAQRLLIEARLQPLQGTRFQPTGFPEIGAAQYDGPDGTPMLLVESAQSMANRLEIVCWDSVRDDWVKPLSGLPLVRVVDRDGRPLTNSVLEAHRINSEYIARSADFDSIKSAIGYRNDRRFSITKQLVPALAKHDINSLIHGAFLEEIAGVIRLPRALSAFVEARGVRVVASGGVKVGLEPGRKEGAGNVIYSREEFVSPEICACFNLDLAQLRGYSLGPHTYGLLVALSLYKVQAFLDRGLRLRTACDLECVSSEVKRPHGYTLPTLQALEAELPDLINAAGDETGFEPVTVTYRK